MSNGVRYTPTFAMPSEYEQQAMEARRRRRMAEMLAAQAYQPQEGGVAPIPTAAPLVQGLQAFLTARQLKKAEEAEAKAQEADVEGFRKLREELGPRSQIAAPSAADIAGSVGMPQISEDGTVSYGQTTMPKLGMESVMPTAEERERTLENALFTGSPTARKYAELLYTQNPESKLMEFDGQLLNVAGGQATPVTMGGTTLRASAKPVTLEKTVDLNDRVEKHYSDGTVQIVRKGMALQGPKDEPLVQVVGPDGKPVLVPRSQGIGKTPFVPGGQVATEAERKDAYNLARIVNSANQIQTAIKEEPAAVRPGFKEAAVGMLPFGVGEDMRYRAQSPQRQVIEGAQTELIDAALTLATGAAYTKEQLAGQVRALIPRYGESDESVRAKNERLKAIINSAKVRAGRAWTPELDQKLAALFPALAEDEITDLPPR